MAITQTGTTLRFLGSTANSGTVSSTIDVPSDAQFVIATWSGFSTTPGYFSSGSMTFTKGGVDTAMTSVAGGDSSGNWSAPFFWMVLPDTGPNQSLKWDWLGSGTASDPDSLCSVTFWTGVDTSSPVRSSNGVNGGGLPLTTSTLTAQTGDLIVAWVGIACGGDGTVDTWANLTLLTQIANSGTADGAWATGSPTGNTTVSALTGTNLFDGGLVAVVIKPGGAPPPAADIISSSTLSMMGV